MAAARRRAAKAPGGRRHLLLPSLFPSFPARPSPAPASRYRPPAAPARHADPRAGDTRGVPAPRAVAMVAASSGGRWAVRGAGWVRWVNSYEHTRRLACGPRAAPSAIAHVPVTQQCRPLKIKRTAWPLSPGTCMSVCPEQQNSLHVVSSRLFFSEHVSLTFPLHLPTSIFHRSSGRSELALPSACTLCSTRRFFARRANTASGCLRCSLRTARL